MENIFYPNKLSSKDLKNLEVWQLKIAALHFNEDRKDCVRLGYGYEYKKEEYSFIRPDHKISENPEIILVADKSGLLKKPISLRDEIDWDDINDILSFCDYSWQDIVKLHISNNL
jgi:hypothetical protein